jgi:hypothetical protein
MERQKEKRQASFSMIGASILIIIFSKSQSPVTIIIIHNRDISNNNKILYSLY